MGYTIHVNVIDTSDGKDITITYHDDNLTAKDTGKAGSEFTIRDALTSKTGYVFKGWATTPNDAAVYTPGQKQEFNADTDLYAVWQKLQDEVPYKIVREYWSDGTKTATVEIENLKDEAGTVIVGKDLADSHENWNTYGSEEYTFKSSTPATLTLTKDGTNVITLRYERGETPIQPTTTDLAIYKKFVNVTEIPDGFKISLSYNGDSYELTKNSGKVDSDGKGILWTLHDFPVDQNVVLTETNATVNGKNPSTTATLSYDQNGTVSVNGQAITVKVTVVAGDKSTSNGNSATVDTQLVPVVNITNTYEKPAPSIAVTKSNDSESGFKFDPETGNAVVNYTVTVTNNSGYSLYGLKLTDVLTPTLIKKEGAEGTPSATYTFSNWKVQKTVSGITEEIEPYSGDATALTHDLALLGRNEEFADDQVVALTYTVEIEPNGVPAKIKLENLATAGYWTAPKETPAARMMARATSTDPFGGEKPDGEQSAGSTTQGSSAGSTTEGEFPAKYTLTYCWNLPVGATPSKILPIDSLTVNNYGRPADSHFTVDTDNAKGDEVIGNDGKTYASHHEEVDRQPGGRLVLRGRPGGHQRARLRA